MRKKKPPPPRKTVKAKGAIPTPVVAPKRVVLPWYKKRGNQVGVAFLSLLLILFLVNVFSDLKDSREKKRLEVRAVEQFERKVSLLNAPLNAVFQSIQPTTDGLVAGTVPVEDYRKAADIWLQEFRKLYVGIKDSKVPSDLESLVEAKALYSQGALIYVDAAKVYIQAAAAAGPDREAALTLAENLLTHAGAVASMGEREFQRLKNDLELNDPVVELPEALIPEEEAPLPPAAPVPVDPAAPGAPVPGAPGAPTVTTSPAAPAPGPAASPGPPTSPAP